MALLTPEIQDKLLTLLKDEGLVASAQIEAAQAESAAANKPVFAVLTEQGTIDDELLTHATAQVSGVPYVNLQGSLIDEKILGLLPEDIA